MPWVGLGLYLVLFFLLMFLVDRLAARRPVSDPESPAPENEEGDG